MRTPTALILALAAMAPLAPPPAEAARLKELVDVEGFRDNALTGIGIVVGLSGTGDDVTSVATRRPLAAMLKKLGTTVSESDLKAKNVAAVVVTADLPPFARPGQSIDVTVSSMGSAKSLQGGTLVATQLKGPDLRVYAIAQGPLTVGGFAVSGGSGSSTAKNHVTAARIPGGASVEREAPGDLPKNEITLVLRDADFTTASRIATAINTTLGEKTASVRDPGAVAVKIGGDWKGRTVELVAALEALEAEPDAPARVVINEKTGTIVAGAHVALGAAAIAHGSITVSVTETPAVSQPGPLSDGGETVTTTQSDIKVEEGEGRLAFVPAAATVGELATALNALGVKPRDLVSIFQALKAAGALRAEIQVQ